MNIVAIDPSLTCTAMVVNDKKFVYTSTSTARTKKLALKGWFGQTEDLITIREHGDTPSGEYVDVEVMKLIHFDNIATKIVSDIASNINRDESTHIAIEGYSFSSAAGPLIDLTTLGSLIRQKIIEAKFKIPENGRYFDVLPPTYLKSLAAKLTYPATPKNKKGDLEYRNKEGVAGGSFKKHEIYKALTENDNLKCEWVEFLRSVSDEILPMKSIPKPIEDINDAKILYEIIRNGLLTNK